jgi:lipopolysaccharide/colanic/teichoic acid biosynthesis glycosyltransferase
MEMKLKKLLKRADLKVLRLVWWAGFTMYYWIYMGTWHAGGWFGAASFSTAAVTGLLATYILVSIGFFDQLRIVVRKSDSLLVLFAMVAAAVVRVVVQSAVYGTHASHFASALITLPVYAGVFFVAYGSIAHFVARVRKRRICLRLREDEMVEFLQTLEEAEMQNEVEILSPAQVLKEFARRRRTNRLNVDLIVFSRAGSRDMQTDRFLLFAHLQGVPVMDRRTCMASLTRKVHVRDIDVWSYVQSARPQTGWLRFGRMIQELLEPLVAAVALVLLLPILLGVAIAIKATSPGPIFYSQRRMGYLGKVFMLYKFRSMRTDSEVKGYQWAMQQDPRVTSIGRFIRKTRLDELPQLWNVMKRDMKFVGPRPERPEIYRDLKSRIPLFSLRTDVRPGITGWAQVHAGYAASIEESELKLEHDLYYIQHMSLRLDLVIILMTAKVVLFGNEFIQRPGSKKAPATQGSIKLLDSAMSRSV